MCEAGQAECNPAAHYVRQPLGLVRHVGPMQAELLPHPREGLDGIQDGLRVDKETFTGQVRRRVTRHLSVQRAVPAHKKYVIRIVNNDDLCVREFK